MEQPQLKDLLEIVHLQQSLIAENANTWNPKVVKTLKTIDEKIRRLKEQPND